MNTADLIAMSPLLVVAATAVVAMLLIAVRRNHAFTAILTMVGLVAAYASLRAAGAIAPRQVTPLLIVDGFAVFYMGMILAAAFAVVVLSYVYMEKQQGNREELYVLFLLATLGSMMLAASSHFASFFLGIELLSIALYAMISYLYLREAPLEAGIKYLVLAASSSAFLLFGMALLYAAIGDMRFARIVTALSAGRDLNSALILPGLALIITGIGFKLALVPFHMWTPDVYQGAPAPVTAFVATVSKGGVFALLLRYFYQSGAQQYEPVFLLFSVIAIASMFAGNLLALLQNNVKRILAYSSIAHFGYLLVAFQAGGAVGVSAATFYLVAYFVTILGAFGIVTVFSTEEREAELLSDYRGLFWRRPILTAIFTAMLFSLAGIPLTAGFLGKFYVVASGASASLWALIIVLVVTSAIGLFYYLRIIVAMYSTQGEPVISRPLSFAEGSILTVLTVLLVWFGVSPGPLLDGIHRAAASLL